MPRRRFLEFVAMPMILVVNLKGGVAKTTNAVALAECLADLGKSVLLIDADHQCMASELLLGEKRMLELDRRGLTLHDMLAAMIDDEFSSERIASFIASGASDIDGGLDGLSVIPCSVRIDDFSTNMAKARRGYRSTEEFLAIFRKRRRAMSRWLDSHFDFTIVDCPPSLALQVRAFLAVADSFIIPAIPERLSVRGSLWLLDRIRKLGVKIDGMGTLWSLYRDQNKMHGKIIESTSNGIEPYAQLPRPFKTIIPNAAAITASSEPNVRPKSFTAKYTPQFSKLYRSLSAEILQRSEGQLIGNVKLTTVKV
jgi:chromosome partitioning protein